MSFQLLGIDLFIPGSARTSASATREVETIKLRASVSASTSSSASASNDVDCQLLPKSSVFQARKKPRPVETGSSETDPDEPEQPLDRMTLRGSRKSKTTSRDLLDDDDADVDDEDENDAGPTTRRKTRNRRKVSSVSTSSLSLVGSSRVSSPAPESSDSGKTLPKNSGSKSSNVDKIVKKPLTLDSAKEMINTNDKVPKRPKKLISSSEESDTEPTKRRKRRKIRNSTKSSSDSATTGPSSGNQVTLVSNFDSTKTFSSSLSTTRTAESAPKDPNGPSAKPHPDVPRVPATEKRDLSKPGQTSGKADQVPTSKDKHGSSVGGGSKNRSWKKPRPVMVTLTSNISVCSKYSVNKDDDEMRKESGSSQSSSSGKTSPGENGKTSKANGEMNQKEKDKEKDKEVVVVVATARSDMPKSGKVQQPVKEVKDSEKTFPDRNSEAKKEISSVRQSSRLNTNKEVSVEDIPLPPMPGPKSDKKLPAVNDPKMKAPPSQPPPVHRFLLDLERPVERGRKQRKRAAANVSVNVNATPMCNHGFSHGESSSDEQPPAKAVKPGHPKPSPESTNSRPGSASSQPGPKPSSAAKESLAAKESSCKQPVGQKTSLAGPLATARSPGTILTTRTNETNSRSSSGHLLERRDSGRSTDSSDRSKNRRSADGRSNDARRSPSGAREKERTGDLRRSSLDSNSSSASSSSSSAKATKERTAIIASIPLKSL